MIIGAHVRSLLTKNGIKAAGDQVIEEDFSEGVYQRLVNDGIIVDEPVIKQRKKAKADKAEDGDDDENQDTKPEKTGRAAGAQK